MSRAGGGASGALVLAGLLGGGCNQAFGLEPTQLVDARPTGCGAPGEIPTFGTAPVPVISDRYTNYYQFDTARTVAIALQTSTVLQGSVDSVELTPAIVDPAADHELTVARLAPEGDQIFVAVRNRSTDAMSLERYDRTGATWEHATTVPITLADEFDRISAPTSRTEARRMLHLTRTGTGFATVIHELVEDAAGTWSPVGEPYSPFMFGVDGIFDPNLSPDGLRVVFSGFGFSGENAIYYADRPSVAARFGPAQRALALVGNGLALSPFLVDDCARIYFYAVPGIHYVER